MKIKIDLICHSGNSGLTDYSVSLANALCKQATVTLVTSNRLRPEFRNMGFTSVLIFRRARYYLFGLVGLICRYMFAPPQIILFQSWLLVPFVDGLLARLFSTMGHNVFVTVHDTLPHHPLPWSKSELGFFYRSFAGLVAHSETSRNGLRELGVTNPILLVPHGVYDLFKTREVPKRSARKQLGIPTGAALVLLLFGHIDRRKGCFEFLEVSRRCSNLGGVHFVLAGRNDLSRGDRPKLDEYRILPNLTLHDSHIEFEEVQNYFRAADIAVLPYLEGTTSGVYKLALAFSVPVLASEVGDLQEIVADGGAISLGSGLDIVNRLEDMVRQLSVGTSDQLERVKANLAQEVRKSAWKTVAASYLRFLVP